MNTEQVALCLVSELAEGQARGFDPLGQGRDSLFAVLHQGNVHLYRNSCPHLDVRLEYRKDRFMSADGQLIICYAHGAQFLPESGLCVYGPCLGERLSTLQFNIENGWLMFACSQLQVCEA